MKKHQLKGIRRSLELILEQGTGRRNGNHPMSRWGRPKERSGEFKMAESSRVINCMHTVRTCATTLRFTGELCAAFVWLGFGRDLSASDRLNEESDW